MSSPVRCSQIFPSASVTIPPSASDLDNLKDELDALSAAIRVFRRLDPEYWPWYPKVRRFSALRDPNVVTQR
jgi:hypothetical protein